LKTRYLSIIVGLFVLVLVGCQQPAGDFAPTFTPPTFVATAVPAVTTYTVAYGAVVDVIETRGQVKSQQETRLTFPLDGALKAVHIAPGDQVEAGALLAELNAPANQQALVARQHALNLAELNLARIQTEGQTAQQADIKEAQANLAVVQAQYDQTVLSNKLTVEYAEKAMAPCVTTAKNDLEKMLCETSWYHARLRAEAANNVALEQLRAARVRLELARADSYAANEAIAAEQVRQAQELYLMAEGQMSSTLLTAPFSGVILSIEKRPGDNVSAYEPIGVLADPSQLWAIATVFEQDIHRVAVGQRVSLVLDAFLDQTYHGSVLQIASQAVLWQGKWAYAVTLVFDDDQTIPATMSMGADIRFVVRARENVLVIPTQAILVSGGREYVELWKDNGALQPVEIQTGISNGIETEVIAGLEAGQVVRIP